MPTEALTLFLEATYNLHTAVLSMYVMVRDKKKKKRITSGLCYCFTDPKIISKHELLTIKQSSHLPKEPGRAQDGTAGAQAVQHARWLPLLIPPLRPPCVPVWELVCFLFWFVFVCLFAWFCLVLFVCLGLG